MQSFVDGTYRHRGGPPLPRHRDRYFHYWMAHWSQGSKQPGQPCNLAAPGDSHPWCVGSFWAFMWIEASRIEADSNVALDLGASGLPKSPWSFLAFVYASKSDISRCVAWLTIFEDQRHPICSAFSKAWLYMILVSVTLAVAAIPEGIPLCVTISLLLGLGAFDLLHMVDSKNRVCHEFA